MSLQNSVTHTIIKSAYYFFIAKLEPFRLEFISDGFEGAAAATKEGLTKGFKVSFFQKTC